MAKRNPRGSKQHSFRNKLVLNQWLISLFGIDPLARHTVNGKNVRSLHKYADPTANIPGFRINRGMLLTYEQNIVRHTQSINEKRHREVVCQRTPATRATRSWFFGSFRLWFRNHYIKAMHHFYGCPDIIKGYGTAPVHESVVANLHKSGRN